MKNLITKTVLLLALLLAAGHARAVVLFSDNFNSYADGALPLQPTVSSATWTNHSGTGGMVVNGGALYLGQNYQSDISTALAGQPYISNNGNPATGTNVFYLSFTVNFQNLPTNSGGFYFAHFKDGASNFKCRLYALTNNAATGNFRLGIANAQGTAAATNLTDLSLGVTYTVVMRYFTPTNNFAPITSTLWINPTSESSTSITAADSTSLSQVNYVAFRQPGGGTSGLTAGGASMAIDNLIVGTSFADVVSGSFNAPVALVQPSDTNVFASSGATFSTFSVGDAGIKYQWYYNTNTLLSDSATVVGSTSNVLTLSSLLVSQSGTYSCVASNTTGTNVTRYALLTVSPVPLPPTITNQPVGSTNGLGATVTLSVVAGGLPAPSFQWKFISANNVTSAIAGATSATYSFIATNVNQSGGYYVTVTNTIGYLTTNSSVATVLINPIPTVSIYSLRTNVDSGFNPLNTNTFYTITGVVTTWTNMTTSTTSSEFYMQDDTAGIAVFWSGAAPSNLPPAGALVRVTGNITSFHNLLEIQPIYSNVLNQVTILTTNYGLPKAQPLPFDPYVATDLAKMKLMESCYMVASNVYLKSEATFVASSNEGITNNSPSPIATKFTNSITTLTYTNVAGQTFTLFVNASTDLPGQAKPVGPVTIYGILGYFDTAGYEFTPSRYADIISYVHQTNVLVNARKGDLATNGYSELVVRSGESLSTTLYVTDPAGGVVTLSPTGTLPTGASWSQITSGVTGSAVFTYTGNDADAGTSFPIQVNVASTAGSSFVDSFTIYVPTLQEQKLAITEFLANPSTNPAAADYNPLARSTVVSGISTNDQFVEIVNLSDSDYSGQFTLDMGSVAKPVFDSFAGFGTTLYSSNSLVIYGGNGNPASTPGISAQVAASTGLALPKTGSGVIELRNGLGLLIDRVVYNSASLSTNYSLTRFPTIKDAFVAHGFVSTNSVSPGGQYDNSAWTSSAKLPAGVSASSLTTGSGNVYINFPASTVNVSTLWGATSVTGPYTIIYGQKFGSSAGTFTNANAGAAQFFYITTQ